MTDGWSTVSTNSRSLSNDMAHFNSDASVRLPYRDGLAERGDWQIRADDPNTVRFVFHDAGQLSVTAMYTGKRSIRVAGRSLARNLGRQPRGSYPCRVEGNAVIIDLNEAQS
jgi:hypothetical protein